MWLFLILVALLGSACGRDDGQGEIGRSEPALRPAGPNARTITYSCASSANHTIVVELRTSDELAGLVNGIDLCEFDGGLVEISVEVPCARGLRTITVQVTENTVTNQSVVDACELGA